MLIWTKLGRNGPWMVTITNCIWYVRTPSKMSFITTNRKFLNGPKQPCLKPEPAQILTVMTLLGPLQHIFRICSSNLHFCWLQKYEKKLAWSFNFTFFYIDDVLSINNSRFGDFVDHIYPIDLEMKDTTDTDMSASYLGLHFEMDSEGQ